MLRQCSLTFVWGKNDSNVFFYPYYHRLIKCIYSWLCFFGFFRCGTCGMNLIITALCKVIYSIKKIKEIHKKNKKNKREEYMRKFLVTSIKYYLGKFLIFFGNNVGFRSYYIISFLIKEWPLLFPCLWKRKEGDTCLFIYLNRVGLASWLSAVKFVNIDFFTSGSFGSSLFYWKLKIL